MATPYGNDYGRAPQYGVPTGPQNTAALVRNVPPSTAGQPIYRPAIRPLELDEE